MTIFAHAQKDQIKDRRLIAGCTEEMLQIELVIRRRAYRIELTTHAMKIRCGNWQA